MRIPVLLICLFVGLAGCESSLDREFEKATSLASQGNFEEALGVLDRILLREPQSGAALKAAREAARLTYFETKDFKRSARYYQSVVLTAPDPEERMRAQKQVAAVYFDHLNDYEMAIVEINKLLPLIRDPSERMKYKMNLARAYYYQNNFFQAEMEVDEFLRISKNEEAIFQMTLLKANIALARKDLGRAAEILKDILKKFPQKARKENVGLSLAVAYEEMRDYKSSIETLQALKEQHPMPDYIELRIKRLQERLKNQPGARGFRK